MKDGWSRLCVSGEAAAWSMRRACCHWPLTDQSSENLCSALSAMLQSCQPLLGCQVGRNVELHSMPPVTGSAVYGDGCSVEPEVDASGWWLDGDVLHLGGVRIGPGARVGTRSMLMPGAEIGMNAEIVAGSCVMARVTAKKRWHGTPARLDEAPSSPSGR